ncbi:uncharacterized protein G2W53_021834 [Senna tora]|uniref:Uncharacterized protein n=1 Tax=Senna tora TaxID=362788 RepID=A0A834TN53_9FABA|nr:uncharacterized protein G2W53_021834 [Senna tora]
MSSLVPTTYHFFWGLLPALSPIDVSVRIGLRRHKRVEERGTVDPEIKVLEAELQEKDAELKRKDEATPEVMHPIEEQPPEHGDE